MISAVPEEQKYECYNIYIAKIAHLLGVTKTRAVFEAALRNLSEDKIILMAIKYAELEKNLNEIERARQIFSYASQFTDPREDYDGLWKTWEELELAEGNKDNYEQYLRVKRSVINKYNMLPPDLKKLEENIRKGLI
jgi:pre-mRNA-splicing factor SYF1